jgi:hypothetical protein
MLSTCQLGPFVVPRYLVLPRVLSRLTHQCHVVILGLVVALGDATKYDLPSRNRQSQIASNRGGECLWALV